MLRSYHHVIPLRVNGDRLAESSGCVMSGGFLPSVGDAMPAAPAFCNKSLRHRRQ